MQSLGFVVEQCRILRVRDVIAGFEERPEVVEVEFGGHVQQLRLRSNGRRPYFICCGCGKNKGALYLPPWGDEFKCRSCHGLRYLDQVTSRNNELRAAFKVRKAAEKSRRASLEAALEVCGEVDDLLGPAAEGLRRDLVWMQEASRGRPPDGVNIVGPAKGRR